MYFVARNYHKQNVIQEYFSDISFYLSIKLINTWNVKMLWNLYESLNTNTMWNATSLMRTALMCSMRPLCTSSFTQNGVWKHYIETKVLKHDIWTHSHNNCIYTKYTFTFYNCSYLKVVKLQISWNHRRAYTYCIYTR